MDTAESVLKFLKDNRGKRFSIREASAYLNSGNRERVAGILDGLAFAGLISFDAVHRLYFFEEEKRQENLPENARTG